MHNLRLSGVHIRQTITHDLVDSAQNRRFQLILLPCTRQITTLTNLTVTAPSRKKVAPADGRSRAIQDLSTTGSVRSIARLATRGMAVAANSNPNDVPASKGPANVGKKDDKKMVTSTSCQ